MGDILIDSNVILDIFTNDKNWCDWSIETLAEYSNDYSLCINPVIYSEISIGFDEIETLENAINTMHLKYLNIPKEALFLAGKVFLKYKKQKGLRLSTLPDFYIGAHAAVNKISLITRDKRKIKSYFPTVNIINPYS